MRSGTSGTDNQNGSNQLLTHPRPTPAAPSGAVFNCAVGLLLADSVEKLSAWMAIMAAANDLARGDLLVMPPSVQMMVFVG